MLNWKTLKKLGDAVLFSSILGSYKTQDQIKIRLDSTRELFKRYVGRVYEDTLPSVSEVEAKEGDMCILIVNDEYIPYEVVSGAWKKYSNGSSSSGGGSVDLTDYYTKNEVNDKLTNLDSKYVRVNDTTLVKLNNENEINLQEDHYNAWFGYRDGKVTNWKFGDGTEGGYADVYVKDLYLNDQKLSDLLADTVKNTDFATSTKGGVIKFSTSHGVNMSADGFLMGATRTAEQYTSNSGNMLINKGTLENVFTSKGFAANTDVVHIKGSDNVIDSKTFISLYTQSSGPSLWMKNTSFTQGTAPATNSYSGIWVQDSEGRDTAYIVHQANKNNSQNLKLSVSNFDGNNVYQNALTFQGRLDGTFNFYSDNPANLGTPTNKWSDIQTEKVNGETVVTPTYLENKAEEWEFTLSDGSTVTKKIVCL